MTIEELEQQIKTLQDEIDKLKSEQARGGIKPWRAYNCQNYFYISGEGVIIETREDNGSFDDKAFLFGNYYRTKELAEQDEKEIVLRNKVRQLRDELCEGYKFEYNSESFNYNYTIYYDWVRNIFSTDCLSGSTMIGTIWFDTEEHAQQACDILNRELKNGNIKM